MASHTSKFEAMPLMEKDEDWEDPDDLVLGPLNSVLENMKYNSRTITRSEFWKAILFASTLSFVAGVTVPYIFYSLIFHHCALDTSHMKTNDSISQNILSEIKEERIKFYQIKLQELNSSVLTVHIKEQWEKQGLDKITILSHNVVFALPSRNKFSKLQVRKEVQSRDLSQNVDKNSSYIKPLCCASGVATIQPIEGDLTFANFGRYEDFLELSKLNVDINGSIVMMKYGMTPTHNKILLAQKLGAKGVILFPSNPSRLKNSDLVNISCNTLLPEETVYSCPSSDQFLFQKKDALTIPVYPVGNEDAEKLLREFGLKELGKWSSGKPPQNKKVRIELYTEDINQTVYSTIGELQGEIESDHFVLVGSVSKSKNSTGLSILLDISQAFAEFLKNGIRPRRSILFCAWGLHNYYEIQSISEWIKDHLEYLEGKVVAYIDVSSSPTELYQFISTPMLQNEITEAEQRVLKHREHGTNFYITQQPNSTLNDQGKARLQLKHIREKMPFHDILGVQSAYLQHECKSPAFNQYGSDCNLNCLHSEVLEDFHSSAIFAQVWTAVVHSLSYSQILHLDVTGLATYLRNSIKDLEEKYGKLLENSILLSKLNDSIEEFAVAADHFHESLKNLDRKNLYLTRTVNDKLVRIGRSFINADCSSKNSRMNVLSAPSSVVACSMVAFPEVTDLLLLLDIENKDRHVQMNKELQDRIFVITSHIKSATKILDNGMMGIVDKND